MLKMGGRGKKNGKPAEIMIIGLSHRNLQLLKEGKPIMCKSADFGCSGDIEIMIFSGEDEQSMVREMESLVGPDAIIDISPKFRT
jgi:hypothetical protein